MLTMSKKNQEFQEDLPQNISESSQLLDQSVLMSALPDGTSNPDSSGSSGGGPQFGMNQQGSWGQKTKGWLSKYGSSVVLPIIALLILAGGIYLYSSQKTDEATLNLEEDQTAAIGEAMNLAEDSTDQGLADIDESTNQELANQKLPNKRITFLPVEENENIKDLTVLTEVLSAAPEGRKEAGKIIETAAKGNGITHLARRALKDYLEDNPQELTNEHKIYIEDYLKDRAGPLPLDPGDELAFDENLIQEAIDASLALSDGQLKNLEKYSALVSWA